MPPRTRSPASSSSEHDGPAAGALGSAFHVLRALWELNHALERASRSMRRRLGVTGPERLVVRLVGYQPGITPRALASAMRLDRSSITMLIQRLERRRLLSRTPNPEDARSVHLHLTPAGRRIDEVRSGTIEAVLRDAVASSAASEVASTTGMLLRIAERLTRLAEQEAPRPAGRRRRGS
ncbi:MAG TPA: MarR family transcriptional regulator [Anaeromyxobacteraceae bacterium]|nr:MarR family transcriptional regulator [Anaeromyxobacteraceae bacterium]